MMSLLFGVALELAPGRGLCATCGHGHSPAARPGGKGRDHSYDSETSHKSWKRLTDMGLNHVRVGGLY